MGTLNTYDPAHVTGVFAGQLFVGLADGTFFNVARDEDAFSKNVGSDGRVIRTRNRNRAGSVTVTLQQSSPMNDVLSAIALADEQGGAGVFPFFLKDGGGTTLVTAPNAWIRKLPDGTFSKIAEDNREWILDCDEVVMHVGGLIT